MGQEILGVVGAGTMGAGIAQVMAQAGFTVKLLDSEEKFVKRGIDNIEKSLQRVAKKQNWAHPEGQIREIVGRIEPTTDFTKFAPCDFVVEAIIEKVEAKIQVFKKLDEILKPEALLASNTSSLPITQMAVATRRPDRFVGTHFFNPVPLMKLVEVVRGLTTSEDTIHRAMALVGKLGKEGVVCKDSPGFIVNRILVPFLNDAIHALAEGVASASEIDNAMKLGANHPIGPLALCDMIGLDTLLYVIEILHTEYQDPKFRPAQLLKQYVRAGWLGQKTGRGFFIHEVKGGK